MGQIKLSPTFINDSNGSKSVSLGSPNGYSITAQLMFNGILTTLEVPSHALFDQNRPSESIANLLDFMVHKYMRKKISSIVHVKPFIKYTRDLMQLMQEHDLSQKLETPEFSDELTDLINLEIIEPVLKVHRAYRFAIDFPQCDKYVLCAVNSYHQSDEMVELSGFKDTITRLSSIAAVWSMANHTGTPFWTLLNVMLESHNCKVHYRAECSGFHEGEKIVTLEYMHNEL